MSPLILMISRLSIAAHCKLERKGGEKKGRMEEIEWEGGREKGRCGREIKKNHETNLVVAPGTLTTRLTQCTILSMASMPLKTTITSTGSIHTRSAHYQAVHSHQNLPKVHWRMSMCVYVYYVV